MLQIRRPDAGWAGNVLFNYGDALRDLCLDMKASKRKPLGCGCCRTGTSLASRRYSYAKEGCKPPSGAIELPLQL